jgi:nitroimidazol reductase NimA-like FMN-containing flavoprotein (pyridoxamine 5'-phosphate oxidase superfamily)
VVRTGTGTKLHAATRNAVLAFEIDGSHGSSGWSVLVGGQSSEVTEISQITTALAAIPDGWVPGEHEHVIRITPSRVSGRRIHHHEQP